MGNNNSNPPPYNDYKLDLHFGGSQFPTQQDSLAHIAATILAKTPQTASSLVAAFLDTSYVPVPVTIEPEEAEGLLHAGAKQNYFTYNEETEEYSLTRRFRTKLIEQENEQEELLADIRASFFKSLASESYVARSYRPFHWDYLQKYAQLVALDFIQTASLQQVGNNGVKILRELFDDAPEGVDRAARLAEAMEHFPEFIQNTEHGQQLYEMLFNYTMYAFRTSISRSGEHRMAEELGRYHLILDTNTMVTAMGLRQNEDLTTAARRILRMLIDSGVTIIYTSEMEKELRNALRHAVEVIERENAVLRDSHEYYPPRTIDAAYYAQRARYPREEFISRYTNLPTRLSKDLSRNVEFMYISQAELDDLCSTADYDEFYDLIYREETNPAKVHHDALHLALVTRLRRRNPGQHYWFVTEHNRLTEFNLDSNFPAPATRLDWLFMNLRQFLPRVENFPEFVRGFASSSIFSAFNPNSEELELKRQYIQNADEREPGEITHSIILQAKSHVFREISLRFKPEQGLEAYYAIKDHQEQDEAKRDAAREKDEAEEAEERRAKKAEERREQLRQKKLQEERYERAIQEESDIKQKKAKIESNRITMGVASAVTGTVITGASSAAGYFEGLPGPLEVGLKVAPALVGVLGFALIDAKAKRDRLALRGELEKVQERIIEYEPPSR